MYRMIEALSLNRTRMQIWIGFLLVMTVVLSVAGGLLYTATSDLLVQTTEEYLGETAKQAGARVDAVLDQIDTVSLQLVMDSRIQSLLHTSKQGFPVPVDQKLSVRPILDNLIASSWIIQSIDIYSETEPFYPLENKSLSELIGNDPATLSKLKAGQMVWAGRHPDDSSLLLAVRQIRLEQDHLAGGGYIVIKVMSSLLDFFNEEFSSIQGSSMHLYDQNNRLVASTSPSMIEFANLNVAGDMNEHGEYPTVRINGNDYLHIIKHSGQFNWSIHILVPMETITNKVSVLKKILLLALAVGIVVCLGLLLVLSSLITMPIVKLRKKMRSVHSSLPTPNEETYFNYEMNELNTAYNKLVHELHQLVETVYEKEKLKNQAEIKMLQAQIHPHFLFNTLESLYWTLIDQHREGADMVIALSRLFRYTIKTAESGDWTRLIDEVEHCRRYLEIMKFRLGHRLNWEIQIDGELHDPLIPKLLIQPLVENAIQHGIEPKLGTGTLLLTIRQVPSDTERLLNIQVKDDGEGMTDTEFARLQERLSRGDAMQTQGLGIGLANVQGRIKLHYGENYGLKVSSSKNCGTEVNLYLPFRS